MANYIMTKKDAKYKKNKTTCIVKKSNFLTSEPI